jgi:hypothetical protein
VAASAIYFMLVYIPNRDRMQSERAAETARAIRLSQLDSECGNRAKPAAQQFILEQRIIDSHVILMGFSNHYNRRLQKCIVEIDTLLTGSHADASGRYFVDAYENTGLMNCTTITAIDHKSESQFECHDADLKRIPADQEDARVKALMGE